MGLGGDITFLHIIEKHVEFRLGNVELSFPAYQHLEIIHRRRFPQI